MDAQVVWYIQSPNLIPTVTVKPDLSGHSKIDKMKVLNTDGTPGGAFCNTFYLPQVLISLGNPFFCLLLRGFLRQAWLYMYLCQISLKLFDLERFTFVFRGRTVFLILLVPDHFLPFTLLVFQKTVIAVVEEDKRVKKFGRRNKQQVVKEPEPVEERPIKSEGHDGRKPRMPWLKKKKKPANTIDKTFSISG